MSKFLASPASRLSAVVLALALCLVGFQPAQASKAPAARATTPIAQSAAGHMGSRLVGHTGAGQRVTGKFIPVKFVRHNGKVYVRGMVQGVVHKAGPDIRF